MSPTPLIRWEMPGWRPHARGQHASAHGRNVGTDASHTGGDKAGPGRYLHFAVVGFLAAVVRAIGQLSRLVISCPRIADVEINNLRCVVAPVGGSPPPSARQVAPTDVDDTGCVYDLDKALEKK